ncbi:hypothetical protein FK220_019865 [Flavobacteriaceae bacterium TP-CH-4]|uniref:Tetratricopeptide repeat protein n=1 Tax=Pelagihabitans pacificus TaxID=2696054 RepID=A0A967B1Y6_9FLAO|nr:hypothetical protein [Pelagihabitans pacificus]NHF61617.1 hypothetical protein [Pelagihabitans pacificus]
MKTEFEKDILEQYDKFFISENPTEKDSLRNDIRKKLLDQNELTSENYQILGLVDYESEDWKNHSERILENFSKSVEKDESNFLARLYLAHIYHDIGNLDLALENYLKVNDKELKKFQLWRYVKLIEQIGYCKYKLGDETGGITLFEKVLEWYRKTEDEYELARPTELLECLPENHKIVVGIKKVENYLD